ncbi:hypothetical protein [Reyranella soli]|uniref:hypothetical protein n=1 Tax=Reyranella soli TaxID=1230389 RepID=UPI001C3F50FF|nr:hypothetical protein [Reyranella soli]
MTVWSSVLLAMIVIGLAWNWAAAKFNAELKRSHPVQWHDLGEPASLTQGSVRRELQWALFLLSRKYRHLDNKRLSALGDAMFFCTVINFALLIFFVFVSRGQPGTGF